MHWIMIYRAKGTLCNQKKFSRLGSLGSNHPYAWIHEIWQNSRYPCPVFKGVHGTLQHRQRILKISHGGFSKCLMPAWDKWPLGRAQPELKVWLDDSLMRYTHYTHHTKFASIHWFGVYGVGVAKASSSTLQWPPVTSYLSPDGWRKFIPAVFTNIPHFHIICFGLIFLCLPPEGQEIPRSHRVTSHDKESQ